MSIPNRPRRVRTDIGERGTAARMRCWAGMIAVLISAACAQQSSRSLESGLSGIDEASFLACSGPPILQSSQGNQTHMSFVTNLTRGNSIGIGIEKTLTPASCSVDSLFVDARLTSAAFSGNLTMCDRVFAPCRH